MGKGGVCAALVTLALAAPSAALAQQPTITLTPSADRVESGATVTLSGQVSDAPAGSEVALAQAPYPGTSLSELATATPDQNDDFSFSVSPQLDTRYQVTLAGTSAEASAEVDVTDRLVVHVKALPLGRAAVRVLVYHPRELHWAGRPVRWWFAPGRADRFKSAPHSTTRYLSPTLISLRTIVALPAGRFRWRACFYAREDQALLDKEQPPGCAGRGYQGHGRLPFGYPSAAAIQRAESYLSSRGGHTALAVVTT
jgi:hypothetical protein